MCSKDSLTRESAPGHGDRQAQPKRQTPILEGESALSQALAPSTQPVGPGVPTMRENLRPGGSLYQEAPRGASGKCSETQNNQKAPAAHPDRARKRRLPPLRPIPSGARIITPPAVPRPAPFGLSTIAETPKVLASGRGASCGGLTGRGALRDVASFVYLLWPRCANSNLRPDAIYGSLQRRA